MSQQGITFSIRLLIRVYIFKAKNYEFIRGYDMNNTLLGALFLTLAASIWGGMYVVVKIVVDIIPPIELVFLRYIIAVITLVIIGIFTKQSFRIQKRHWGIIVLVGLIGNTISIVTQEAGTMLSNAQMGAIITSTTPAFMILFATMILRERLTFQKALSVVLATIGVLYIVGASGFNTSFKLGGISLIIAAITWALQSVLVKKIPVHYSQIVVNTYTAAIAVILLSPIALPKLFDIPLTVWTMPNVWLCILYLGIISTACGFLLWNKGLQLMPAGSGSLFFFFQPIVGAVLGWLMLGEQLGLSFWTGTALIFIGIILALKQ